jgi:hypothetical protein
MRPDVHGQLADYFAYVDKAQGSVDVLDLIEPVLPVEGPAGSERPRRRRPLLAALTVAAIVAGVVLLATRDETHVVSAPPPDATGLEVSESFIAAWVGGDGEAAARLFNADGIYGTGVTDLDQLPALHDWYRAVGWEFQAIGCRTEAVTTPVMEEVVDCSFTAENDMARALDWSPVQDGFRIVVDGPGIQHAGERYGFDAYRDLWFTFKDWVAATHPDDLGRMFLHPEGQRPPVRNLIMPSPFEALNAYPLLDAESIGLWDSHTDEFVTSPEAVAAAREELRLARYVSAAVAICTEADDAFTGEVAGLRQSQTETSQQLFDGFSDLDAEAAWHEAAARHADDAMARLAALPVPESRGDLLEWFYARVELEVDLVREAAVAAAAGDATLVETLERERVDATHRKDSAGFTIGYGLWACPIGLPR